MIVNAGKRLQSANLSSGKNVIRLENFLETRCQTDYLQGFLWISSHRIVDLSVQEFISMVFTDYRILLIGLVNIWGSCRLM